MTVPVVTKETGLAKKLSGEPPRGGIRKQSLNDVNEMSRDLQGGSVPPLQGKLDKKFMNLHQNGHEQDSGRA